MRYMAGAAATLLVFTVGAGACGGDDDPPSSADGPAASADDPPASAPVADTSTTSTEGTVANTGADEESPGSLGATVVLGDTTYEFSDGSCTVTVGGDVVSEFVNGDDNLNVTLVNRTGLIRATLDGELWTDMGQVGEPDSIDAGNVTWSGALQKQNVPDSATDTTITLSC